MSRILFVVPCIVLLLSGAAASALPVPAALPSHRFQDRLFSPDPIRLLGGLAMPVHQDYVADIRLPEQAQSSNVAVAASQALVSIVETKYRTYEPRTGRSDSPIVSDVARETNLVRVLEQPRIDGVAPSGEPHLFVASGYQSQGGLALDDGTSCGFQIAPFDHRGFETVTSYGSRRDRVAGDCTVTGLTASGNQTLYFWNVTMTLTYKSTRHDGSTDSETVRAGRWTEPDPTLPDVVVHIRRMLIVGGFTTPSFLRHDGPARVQFNATNVTAIGQLTVPPSMATVMWGDFWAFEHRVDALAPSGVFLIGPGGDGTMDVRGQTINEGPRVAKSVATAPSAFDPTLLAGVAALSLPLAFRPFRRAVMAGAIGLFTRLSQADALGHDRRRAILDAVEAQPGVRVQGVAEMLGLRWSIVHYHVRVLARQGLLVLRRFGRETALFTPGKLDWKEQERIRLLRKPVVQRLLALLATNPRSTQVALAQALAIRQSYVSTLLRGLTAVGLVQVSRPGRGRSYEPVLRRGADGSGLPDQSTRSAPTIPIRELVPAPSGLRPI